VDVKTLIEGHEDRKKKIYKCTAGKWTGGVGRNLEDVGFSDDEIDLMFANDLKRAQDAASKYPWFADLSEVRQAAVLDLLFNLGPTRFAGFRNFIQAMSLNQYAWAAAELRDSKWFSQVGRRGPRIASMIRNDTWPS
jgi:lysozyme